MGWYYSKMGLQQGPVPEDELIAKIRRGEIGATSLVWREGMVEWKPLGQVPELSMSAAITSETSVGNTPRSQPPAYVGENVSFEIPSYMTASIVSLVLWSISMLIICLPVGMPCAIVALVYGTKVDSLRAQQDFVAAQAASNSARIWMITSFVLMGLPVFGVIGLLVFLFLQ